MLHLVSTIIVYFSVVFCLINFKIQLEYVEPTYNKSKNNEMSQNMNGECTNGKIDVKQKYEKVNNEKDTIYDKNHKNIVKNKTNKKDGYKNETIMIKDNDNKNTNLKCKHASDNKIVNAKYDVNKNGPVARNYDKDMVGSIQND